MKTSRMATIPGSTISPKNMRERSRTPRAGSLTSADIARAKDITLHPGFRGEISRALWRFWMCRLTPAGQYLAWVTVLFIAFGSNSMQVQAYIPSAYLAVMWIVAALFALFSKTAY